MQIDVREPRPSDLDAVLRIHADPRTNIHWPQGAVRNIGQAEEVLAVMLRCWREDGIGYWAVTYGGEESVIGFSGVRVKPARTSDYFNLYYRYAPEYWGRGIARDVAGRALVLAHEFSSERPVIARMRGTNLPSQRVALAIGLTRAGHDSMGRVLFADRRLYPSLLESLR